MRRLCYFPHYLSSLEEVIITGENSGKLCKVVGLNLKWNIILSKKGGERIVIFQVGDLLSSFLSVYYHFNF